MVGYVSQAAPLGSRHDQNPVEEIPRPDGVAAKAVASSSTVACPQ